MVMGRLEVDSWYYHDLTCNSQFGLLCSRNAGDFFATKQEIGVFEPGSWVGLARSPRASINCRWALAFLLSVQTTQSEEREKKE